jgi:uncharacterized protein (TIGR04222 family)
MIPFTLNGPEFVAFYIGLLVTLAIVAGVVRSSLRGPSDDRFPPTPDSYQAAYLAGGFSGAAEGAIVALAARDSLRLDPGGRFVAVEPKPAWLHPVEDAVWTAAALAGAPASATSARRSSRPPGRMKHRAARGPALHPSQVASYERVERLLRPSGTAVPGATPAQLRQAARPALGAVRDQLRRAGLVMGDAQAVNVRTVPTLVVLGGGVLGGVRLALGMAAGHAVGYLVALLVVTLVVALLFFRQPGPRTHRGDRLVPPGRRTTPALRPRAAAAAAGMAGADLALAIGLWGPDVLSGSPLDDVRRLLRPMGSSGDGGGSSDGSGGGDGGSCGGGCGGGCGG